MNHSDGHLEEQSAGRITHSGGLTHTVSKRNRFRLELGKEAICIIFCPKSLATLCLCPKTFSWAIVRSTGQISLAGKSQESVAVSCGIVNSHCSYPHPKKWV